MNAEQIKEIYLNKSKYIDELDPSTLNFKRLLIETVEWKMPHLMQVIPADYHPKSVAEVGCFTGHLIGNMAINGRRDFDKFGYDINPNAINAAQSLYPEVSFQCNDVFTSQSSFDLLVLSDIVEHIEDDISFLKKCKPLSKNILLNLPLEKSVATIGRKYGFDDPSGHLRAYSLSTAKRIIHASGYKIINSQVVCVVENHISKKVQSLFGDINQTTSTSLVKTSLRNTSRHIPGLSKFLYGSNLFAFLTIK